MSVFVDKVVSVSTGFQDERYLRSGKWKCERSPTGAHWWQDKHTGDNTFSCACCHTTKTFPFFFPFPGENKVFIDEVELCQPDLPKRSRRRNQTGQTK